RPPISPLSPYTTLFRSLVAPEPASEPREHCGFSRDCLPCVGHRGCHAPSSGRSVKGGGGRWRMVEVKASTALHRLPPTSTAFHQDRKSTRLNSSHDQTS